MAKRVCWRCGQILTEVCRANDCDVMRNDYLHGSNSSTYQLEILLCPVYRGGVISGSLEV